MRRRGERLVAGGLAATLALGGCSFAAVYGPPPVEHWPTEQNRSLVGLAHCTASPVLPIVDGVVTMGLFSGAGFIAAEPDSLGANVFAAGLLVLPGLIYLASTLYGIGVTSSCRIYQAGPPYPFQPVGAR